MPLLAREPNVFPATLFDEPTECDPAEKRWWALYTRPRAEKSLARQLFGRGISFFLPLYKKQTRGSKRSFTSYLPLFTSYLFLYGDEKARIHALETNLVSQTLFAKDQDQLQTDLVRVHKLMESGLTLVPQEKLIPGRKVEIISGSLTGVQGKIIQRAKKTLFHVEVEMLQSAVVAEIEGWMIRPIADEKVVGTSA